MLKLWQFWSLTAIAVIVAVLALTNIVLFSQNREGQTQVAGRAQYIQQSVQLEALYKEIVKALADLSVRNKDSALTELLARQGLSVSTAQPPAQSASSTSAVEAGKKGR